VEILADVTQDVEMTSLTAADQRFVNLMESCARTIAHNRKVLMEYGAHSYYAGVPRDEMPGTDTRDGWDEAHGYDCWCKAQYEAAIEVDDAQSEVSSWMWA
jgi:hypothetical protein